MVFEKIFDSQMLSVSAESDTDLLQDSLDLPLIRP